MLNRYQQFIATEKRDTQRVLFRCQRCKRVFAHEYSAFDGGLYRAVEQSGMAYLASPESDARCPLCRSQRVTSGAIKASITHTHCDERCESATGFICNCSCGGANHGSAYLKG